MTKQEHFPNNNFSNYDNLEGGIDIGKIKNTIVRRYPLIILGTLTFTLLAFLKTSMTPSNYKTSLEILSESLNIQTTITSNVYDERSTETTEKIVSLELDDIQIKLLKSPTLIMRVVELLKDKYPSISYETINNNLVIQTQTTSNKQSILLVEYKNPNQQQVLDVINSVAKIYIDYSLEKKQSAVKQGITFVDDQIPEVNSEIKKIENQISNLRTTYNFIDPEISIQQVNNNIVNLSAKKEEIEIERKQLQLKLEKLEKELTPHSINSTTAIELATPRYLQLLDQLKDIDVEIARSSAIYLDNSLEIQTLKQAKQKIVTLLTQERAAIFQKLNNQMASLDLRKQNKEDEILKSRLRINQLSNIVRDYERLQENLKIANNKLNAFTLQKDAFLTDLAQKETPWQLLTPPLEPKIDNSNKYNYILLSFSLGLLISIGIVLFIDSKKQIIRTIDEIEEVVNLPIISNVPYLPNIKQLSFLSGIQLSEETEILRKNNHILFNEFDNSIETFRSLAISLGMIPLGRNVESMAKNNIKSIVITSAIPREGKSTIAWGLARSCASLGNKTLIVDADVRSVDCLTTNLGFQSELGLINMLNQDNDNLDFDCIKQLNGEKNLYLMTSGLNPLDFDINTYNSSYLLASRRMYNLMEKLKTQFDTIIYDCCSVNGFADISLMAAHSDGALLVTGLGKIQKMSFIESLNQLRLFKIPILGIVINKLNSK